MAELFDVSADYLLGLSNNETDIAQKLMQKIETLEEELGHLKEIAKKLY